MVEGEGKSAGVEVWDEPAWREDDAAAFMLVLLALAMLLLLLLGNALLPPLTLL